MKAMVLKKQVDLDKNQSPLEMADIEKPVPKAGGIRIKISVCGVCHTELDIIEGGTPPPGWPLIPGHQVVGRVDALGDDAKRFQAGDRVGVAWIYFACGECGPCLSGNENLCRDFLATGRDANGGYAQYMCVSEDFAYAVPDVFSDSEAAPLLCAGAIGYRSLRLTGIRNGQRLGLTGFGASGHLVLQTAKHQFPDTDVYVFARSEKERAFSKELGAVWAGTATEECPERLDAVIDTTPAWTPVVEALKNLAPGGRLVINAIRKEAGDKAALAGIDYPVHLWMEKEIKSVANISRRDVWEFLSLAAEMNIKPEIREYPLEAANKALIELKTGRIRGAKVLRID